MRTKKKEKINLLYIFSIIPLLFFIVILYIYPIIMNLYLSVYSDRTFMGLQNYLRILASKEAIYLLNFPHLPYGYFLQNLLWILIHLPITIFGGYIIAYITRGIKGGMVVRAIIYTGMLMPIAIVGLTTNILFQKGIGALPAIFDFLGMKELASTWLTQPDLAIFALIIMSIWSWIGFCVVTFSAALEAIPKDYYDAAEVDGAGPLSKMFRIIFPMVKNVTIVTFIVTLTWEIKLFDLIYITTRGGPNNTTNIPTLQIYLYLFKYFNQDMAATLSIILILLMLPFAIILTKARWGRS